jgi:hypothetical protein
MMDKKVHSEDYIAIPSFKNFIIQLFRLTFTVWSILGLAIRKGYMLLIAGTVAGAVVGLLLHLVTPKNFKVSMLVQYTVLDKRAYTNELDQMENLVRTRSYEVIAEDLKVSPMVAENINRIEGLTLDDLSLNKDTSSYPYFKIEVGLKSPYGVDSLQTGLLSFFNDLPYLKKQKEDQIRILKDQLTYIESETGKMDSLKQEYTRSLASMKMVSGVYSNAFDPANIYHQSYQLDTMRASITNWLNSKSQPMVMISGFRATREPQSISRSVSIVVCILSGFLISLFVAVCIELNKKLNGA